MIVGAIEMQNRTISTVNLPETTPHRRTVQSSNPLECAKNLSEVVPRSFNTYAPLKVQKATSLTDLSEPGSDTDLDCEEKKVDSFLRKSSFSNDERSTYESLTNLEEAENTSTDAIESQDCYRINNSQPLLEGGTNNYSRNIIRATFTLEQLSLNLIFELYSLYKLKRDSLRLYLSSIWDIEVKLYIIRAIGYCLALAFSCVILLWKSDANTIPYNDILAISYSYLTLLVIENIIRAQCMQRDSWRRLEDAFAALDAVSGLFFLTCLTQRSLNPLLRLVLSTAVLMISNVVYPIFSQAPKVVKLARTLLKTYYTAQGFLLMAQYNQIIDLDWRNVFTPTWCYLTGTLVFISLLSIMIIIFHAFHLIKALRWLDYADAKISLQDIISGIWYLGYGSSGLVVFLTAFGVCQRLENFNEYNLIRNFSILGLCLASGLIFCAVSAFNILVKCIGMYAGIQLFEELANPDDFEYEEPQWKITLMTEEKEAYFIQYSETYFVSPDSDRVQKIKEIISKKVQEEAAFDHGDCMSHKHTMNVGLLSDVHDGYSEVDADNFCYVCCEKRADAILGGCRHGGICYECAETLIRKKAECMECRSAVDGIFQLDLKAVCSNVYRSRNFCRVIKTQTQRRIV